MTKQLTCPDYCTSPTGISTYQLVTAAHLRRNQEALFDRFGVSRDQVRYALDQVGKRWERLLCQEIRDQVGADVDVEEEITKAKLSRRWLPSRSSTLAEDLLIVANPANNGRLFDLGVPRPFLQFINLLKPWQQPLAIGDLNGQAGPGIRFQKHGTMLSVNHDIHADVTQAHGLGHAPRHVQDLVPVRYAQAHHRHARVRMCQHRPIALHRMMGQAAMQVDPGANAALVQIGSAVGCLGRQPQHGHGRLVAIEDHADIRNALVGNRLEDGVQAHSLLKDGAVRPAAQ